MAKEGGPQRQARDVAVVTRFSHLPACFSVSAAALVRRFPFLQLLPAGREVRRAPRDLALCLVEGPLRIRARTLESIQHPVIVLVAGVLVDPVLLALAAPGI